MIKENIWVALHHTDYTIIPKVMLEKLAKLMAENRIFFQISTAYHHILVQKILWHNKVWGIHISTSQKYTKKWYDRAHYRWNIFMSEYKYSMQICVYKFEYLKVYNMGKGNSHTVNTAS